MSEKLNLATIEGQNKFNKLDNKEKGNIVSHAQYEAKILNNLSDSHEIIKQIISNKRDNYDLVKNEAWEILADLPYVQRNDILDILIEHGRKNKSHYWHAINAIKFADCDFEPFLAHKMIEALDKHDNETPQYLLDNISKFNGIDKVKFLKEVIQTGHVGRLSHMELSDFRGLSLEDAAVLLADQHARYAVFENVKSFSVDHNQLIAEIIKAKALRNMGAENIKELHLLSCDTALKIIKASKEEDVYSETNRGCKLISSSFESFEPLNSTIAEELIKNGNTREVVQNLRRFQGLDYVKITQLLIAKKAFFDLTMYVKEYFPDHHQEVAEMIIDCNENDGEASYYLMQHLEDFHITDYNKLANKLIDGTYPSRIFDSFYKWKGLSNEIVLKLIEKGLAKKLVEHLPSSTSDFYTPCFKDLNLNTIALKLIEHNQAEVLCASLGKFKELEQDVAIGLARNGKGRIVIEKTESFSDLKINDLGAEMIRFGESSYVSNNLDKFEGLENRNENLGGCFPSDMTIENFCQLAKTPSIGTRLTKGIENLKNFSFKNEIELIINAQGESAFLYFEAIKKVRNFDNITSEDVAYITYVGKKYGTQARNILENIVGKVESISGEKETIEEYIQEVGIAQYEVYSEYKKASETGDIAKVEELKERVLGLQNKIYAGKMTESDFEDDLYRSVSYYTFPPAMGLTQDQYNRLNSSRPDRRDDVPKSLDSIQYTKIGVPTGKYVLEQGSELDLKEWSILSEVVKKVNAEIENGNEGAINAAGIGEKLVKVYRQKSQNTEQGKSDLFESMYKYHLFTGGGELESGYDISIDGLMKYKEFIGDRIKNDLVKDCLAEWRSINPEQYEELKKETLNRLKQNENQNFAKVKNMLEGIKKQRGGDKKQGVIEKLDDFLTDFGLSYESVQEIDSDRLKIELGSIAFDFDEEFVDTQFRTEEYYNSEEFIGAYDDLLARSDQDILVVQKISSDLVAGINKKMRKELDKFEFSSGGGKVEEIDLEFAISKKKEHGVAGYNMGVCVTPDKKLWDDHEFMNCIMFNSKTKQAVGGMHFLIRENCLCLPGINPSMDLLSEVENDALFNKMINYAKQVKESLGLDKILIPVKSGIHSNRQPVQEIIRKKNFKKVNLEKEAEFSYDPHKYSFKECFEVT
jgi:hypothetical protein